MLLFISGPEIFVVLLVIIMFFGADKIPEMARFLGKGMKQIRQATDDIKREINASSATNGLDDLNEEFQGLEDLDPTKEIKESIEDITDEITGPIKRKF